AADDCETATKLDSSNAKAYFRKATALKGLGRLDEAISSISLGLEFEPTNATALKERESLVGAKSQLEKVQRLLATKQFSRALTALDPLIRDLGSGSRDLNLIKVECLVETRRLEEALNLSNAIMRSVPAGDVELLQVRAKCLLYMGDVENAYKHLQQAMRCDPDNTAVRTEYRRVKELEGLKERGNTAFSEGRYEEALQEWQACIDIDPSNKLFISKIYGNRASAFVKLKRLEEAVDACSLALKANEHNIKARLRRADSNYSLGGEDRLAQALRCVA
ncbi:dnajc7, partial [Symbiodinium microadriaticum]